VADDQVVLAVSGHLTDRDRYLVRTVGEHRVLSTGQLAALGFGSIITARHRLGVLAQLGVLRRFRPRRDVGSAPWHYLLGPVDLLADPVGVRRSISLTGQYAAVDDMLTGQGNLELMARLLRLPRREARARADELLMAFGLTDAGGRRVRTYSGGMRRRLDLAISMITQPQLLFLDEPTAGLDPRSREQLWGEVRRLAGEGVTVLLTTQYLEEADQLADRIAVLDHGRVIAEGTPDDLKSSVGTEVVRLQFADDSGCARAAAALRAGNADRRLRTIEIETQGSATEVRQLLGRLDAAGIAAMKVSTRRPSLDDVFMALTAAGQASENTPGHVPGRRAVRTADEEIVR
jgi:ABC-2 type transport system ATP-binding protein